MTGNLRIPKLLGVVGIQALSVSLFLPLLTGCYVARHGDSNGKEDVDIRTPVGSLSVRTGNPDPAKTGLALYPGAEIKKSSSQRHDANVDISSSLFGMELVVMKYQSSDPPEKVLDFYRKDMARYGKVVDCAGGFTMAFHHHDRDAEVTCEGHNGSSHDYKEELKVGTENHQRIVAVKPVGTGSEFALVYVRARDSRDTM